MSRWRDRIRISGGFWLLAAWFTLVNGWQLLAVILSAAALHELGHLLVLRLLGAETLVVTNAAGTVNTAFSAGDIMLITDHIKLFGVSPLCGPNLEEFGPRFPDSSYLYTPKLQALAKPQARALDIDLKTGVYMYFPGPQYETPAEIRMARILGADAVGMSTAPEVITAGHCGMDVLGITLVSNMAAGVLPQKLTEQEVLDAAEAAKEKFSGLLLACLAHLDEA